MDKKSDIQVGMQDLDALASYVQMHLQKNGGSYQAIADNAEGRISHQTVWNIVNRRVSEVKERTLAALARGLGVSLEEIQAVVKGKPITLTDPFEALKVFFHGWEAADDEDKRAVMAALQLIGEAFRQRTLHKQRSPSKSGRHVVKEDKPGKVRRNSRSTKNG